jgi:hypothetical protein
VVDTVNAALELPAAAVIVAGETTMLKFPTGGGGGEEFGPVLHAVRLNNPMQRINSGLTKLMDWD